MGKHITTNKLFFRLMLLLASGIAAGTILGWLMAYLISGPASAERYLSGIQSNRLLGLKGLELLYFILGYTIGMTASALYIIKLFKPQKQDL
jgi:hypothetical protein